MRYGVRNKTGKTLIFVIIILSIIGIIRNIKSNSKLKNTELIVGKFEQIKTNKKIVVLTLNSSISYFSYRTIPMGYDYELVKDFCKEQGWDYEIKIANSEPELIQLLLDGEGDLAAFPIPITQNTKQQLLFCGQSEESGLVLVQNPETKEEKIKNVTELIGKEIVVIENSNAMERLQNLNNELGGGIIIKPLPSDSLSSEEIIELVAKKKVKYTISNERIAQLNKTYYNFLNISVKVGFPQRYSWAVAPGSDSLANRINHWAEIEQKSSRFNRINKRYFELSKSPPTYGGRTIPPGALSPFDDLFKKYAPQLDWDWRLLAAIAFQESRFQSHLTSWAGARGVMGIMPATGRAFGASREQLYDPEINIKTSVKCLIASRKSFKDSASDDELIQLTLASYNAGVGHVYDAQRLAKKYGLNPYIWKDNVEEGIKMKSDPKYYNDSICKFGYLRGNETLNYVSEIMERYKHYKNTFKP